MADTRTRIINLPEATTLDSSMNFVEDSAGGSGTRRVTYETLKGAINQEGAVNLAPAYSNAATYAVGDLCTYQGKLYSCSTQISTAEDWTAAHWTSVNMSSEVKQLKNDTSRKVNAFKNVYDAFDGDIEINGYYRLVNGQITWTHAKGIMSTGYIPVEPQKCYRGSTWGIPTNKHFLFYDVNKSFVSSQYQAANGYITIPQNVYYFRTAELMENRFSLTVCEGIEQPPSFIAYGETSFAKNGAVDSKVYRHYGEYVLEPYEIATGYMKNDGTIDTSISGGLIKKYRNLQSEVFVHGTTGLGTDYSIVWVVENGEPISVIETPGGTGVSIDYVHINVNNYDTAEVWLYATSTRPNYLTGICPVDAKARSEINKIMAVGDIGEQWEGKSWFAYGTSITNINAEGKYPTYLAQMSGLVLTNKGISGGGIGNLGAYSTGQVYSAICNLTDGKTNADLITLETGANDVNENVPLGTIYDTGTETLAGCLNDCIRYLQANTNAQIAITVSPATKIAPVSTNKYYEWAKMVEEICHLNRVHFLNADNSMGYAKIADSTKGPLYVVDDIHQTDLGGYIMAQNLWYQLRNIPLFYTAIPE